MLFHLYGLESVDDPARYCVYEQNPSKEYERRLSKDDRPMQVRRPALNKVKSPVASRRAFLIY